MIHAAGILFLAPGRKALFLKRAPGSDHTDTWGFPGGRLKSGEDAEAGALREAREELGSLPKSLHLTQWARQIADGVDYTTFLCRVPDIFSPDLNDEHTGHRWASLDDAPEPTHPGVSIALDKFGMDELDIAKAIRDGELTSPQRYENISLVNLRISGTGTAYRSGLKEFVYRKPEVWLTDRFLERCNGLQVILEHPDGNMLNSKEFNDRTVGAIFVPYIKGDEVWGIAKIYDDSTRDMFDEELLSTSPAVVFRDPSVNTTEKLDDGSTLLIEGDPNLLDHLAICERGVWDKGGEPTGVKSATYGDSIMPTPEEDRARADAEAGEKLDKILSHMDTIGQRMDSMEERLNKADSTKSRRDGETEEEMAAREAAAKADKGRRDGETEEEANARELAEKADKARRDGEETEAAKKAAEEEEARKRADAGELANLREKLADMDRRIPKEIADEDMDAMADAQAKADAVLAAHGKSAGRPLNGEGILAYRKRMARDLQTHSPDWKGVNLNTLPGEAFNIAERAIFADAVKAAKSPTTAGVGLLREVRNTDRTGRVISTFVGDPDAWMSEFKSPKRRLVGIQKDA